MIALNFTQKYSHRNHQNTKSVLFNKFPTNSRYVLVEPKVWSIVGVAPGHYATM